VLKNTFSPIILLAILFLVVLTSPSEISGFPRLLIQILMMLWLGSLVVQENHHLQLVMTFPIVKRIGQISYGMYVYHMFALHICRELIERIGIPFDYALFLFGSIVTFIIADISFRFYETPILKLKNRFT